MATAKPIVEEINLHLNELNTDQRKAVLTMVKTFAAGQKDCWDEISPEQQNAIDKALLEVKAGKVTPHKAMMKNYIKWLK